MCYQFNTNRRRYYTDALFDCTSQGGTLVIIKNAELNLYISDTLQVLGSGEAWIGLSDEVTEGTYVWTDGTLAAYQNWALYEGALGNQHSADCVTIDPGVRGKWRDHTCGHDAGWAGRLHLFSKDKERQYVCQFTPTVVDAVQSPVDGAGDTATLAPMQAQTTTTSSNT